MLSKTDAQEFVFDPQRIHSVSSQEPFLLPHNGKSANNEWLTSHKSKIINRVLPQINKFHSSDNFRVLAIEFFCSITNSNFNNEIINFLEILHAKIATVYSYTAMFKLGGLFNMPEMFFLSKTDLQQRSKL